MDLTVRFEISLDNSVKHLLHQLVRELCGINSGITGVMATFDELVAQVEENTAVEASAVAAINGLAEQLQAILDRSGTPEEIQAVIDRMKASAAPLAAAVAANTAAPAPTPVPEPAPVPEPEPAPAPDASAPADLSPPAA